MALQDTATTRSTSEDTESKNCETHADACADLALVGRKGDEDDRWQGDVDAGEEAHKDGQRDERGSAFDGEET